MPLLPWHWLRRGSSGCARGALPRATAKGVSRGSHFAAGEGLLRKSSRHAHARAPLIGSFAVLYPALAVMLGFVAGLGSSDSLLDQGVQWLTLPASLASPHAKPGALDDAALLVTSLIWGGALSLAFFARRTWSRRAMFAGVALLAGLFACVWVYAWTRPVSFDGARLVDFADWQLFVPGVFEPATIEEAAMRQIHENLSGASPMPRPQERRWYWDYRATLSGSPEYRAVVLVARADRVHDEAAFLARLDQQRDLRLIARPWTDQPAATGFRISSGLPRLDPLAAGERDRLIRATTRSAVDGLWIGIIARHRDMAPDEAAAVIARMARSVERQPAPTKAP